MMNEGIQGVYQRARARSVKNTRRLHHLHHEGGSVVRQIVRRSNLYVNVNHARLYLEASGKDEM